MREVDLIDCINNIHEKKALYIADFDAYAINSSGCRGVAVETSPDVMISENFYKVKVETMRILINEEIRNLVVLYTEEDLLSEQYGALCINFLDLKNRDIIKKTPMIWFNEWQELLGNTKKNKMVYDVIGEMKVLLFLQKNGENPIWNSIEEGTFDISTNQATYEVKTSKSKTSDSITIHNQFQLDKNRLKNNLYIAYVRVEKKEDGDSIDSLYKELISAGFNRQILDDYLRQIGYNEGKEDRFVRYLVYEIRLYLVDDDFPAINLSSFKDEKIPDGIINYQYTISLNSLKYTNLLQKGEK